MKTPILLSLLLAAVSVPNPAFAARVQDAQQVLGLDLNACPRPPYPAQALAQRIGGTTTVEVQVGAAGLATDARVAVSSGRPDLDEAALAGVRSCVFHAVVATGQAPTGWLKTQYVWKIAAPKAKPKSAAEQVPASFEEARTRAAAGDAVAQNRLGDMYARAIGVPRDVKQAREWYERAAAQGDARAMLNLAGFYQTGLGGEMDVDKARQWLTRAADTGLADAQLRLGLFAMRRAASDDERAAAAAWIARAAEQDFVPALYYLGRSFELGLGNAQDAARATALYRRALGASEGRAETALGMLAESDGARVDEAAKLYEKAMRWRYPPAFYRYGLVLEGRGDTELAAAVYLQGAQLGDCDATVKYVQLKQVAGSTPAAGTPDAWWLQRSQMCAARPAPSVQL